MRNTQDIITRLLRNIGTRKEVEQYLKLFSSVDSKRFAVIKVGGAILARELEGLASSLTFLHHIGLYPIVIHGIGLQYEEALAAAGIADARVDGQRVMKPEALEVARRVFQRENLKLCETLEELGTRARPLTAGTFRAEAIDFARLGLVGRIAGVHLDGIESSIAWGCLPIVASLGETSSGQILYLGADGAARALAQALQPFKIVFLNEKGGLLDGEGQLLPAINLAEDYEPLLAAPGLHPGTRLKLQEIKQLLDGLPHTSSVSITSPDHLAKELFTHHGSGTLVRQGERVGRHDSIDGIDRARLRGLLEECFQRRLADDYFEHKDFFRVYLADSYRATAILTREGAIPYLDKFAVTQEGQGVGVGASIWQRMQRENPKLYWRSRRDNPINAWYFERADGSWKSDRWTVFWCGLDDHAEVRACVERALALPATFS